ncbi:hypothetical protein UNDKW_1653 [Undibacterium sp. KW1]|uniref:hypothetical protein n=1 Tax=Undibacterium sp. KW1 TaxID=2058624 RepID=UPI001331E573|nr:hypothetical protein [Undibacterium sp. KW1]BBB59926.1 hypothetical protein UNDKW_1653 [Undibacterium sp. KW1]
MSNITTITLGELRSRLAWLKDLSDDTEIFFGSGDLTFYRAKTRKYKPNSDTPMLINIEFNEIYAVTASFPDDEPA